MSLKQQDSRARSRRIAGMQDWEYCRIEITLFREGTGGGTRELLAITRPGATPESITHPFGVMGLLNQLGGEGWELVDVAPSAMYLKRPKKK
jgi:hypothetical protein